MESNRASEVGLVNLPSSRRKSQLRFGYVGLVDSAPLFVAADLGMFKKQGLEVQLSREVGWASIREKLHNNELDAAQAPCPMPFATTLGLQSTSFPCAASMIISRGGNAIILSKNLRKQGVHDGVTFKQATGSSRYLRKHILATVYPYSSHTFLLKDWLRSSGIDPDRDVQIVTLPPSQMCRNLAAGTIDGFCSGEPWPSMAIAQEIGWSPATSADILPGHPEKVLMTTEAFNRDRREQHVSLVAALIEASAFCENPTNRTHVARIASNRKRVNCDPSILASCLSPKFDYGYSRIEDQPQFLSFHNASSNSIQSSDVEWILNGIRSYGIELGDSEVERLSQSVVRSDIYQQALDRLE